MWRRTIFKSFPLYFVTSFQQTTQIQVFHRHPSHSSNTTPNVQVLVMFSCTDSVCTYLIKFLSTSCTCNFHAFMLHHINTISFTCMHTGREGTPCFVLSGRVASLHKIVVVVHSLLRGTHTLHPQEVS